MGLSYQGGCPLPPSPFSPLYPCHARDGGSAEDTTQLPDKLPTELPPADKRVTWKPEGPNPPGSTLLSTNGLTRVFKESRF